MQTYPVKRTSSSENNVSKPDYDHAADFDFNQKNGINSDETQAQKAAELLAKEQAGEISPEELQKELAGLVNGDDAQKQLVEKMADELMKDLQQGSGNLQEKLNSLIENALHAVKTGNHSDLDPHLLFLVKAKTQDQNPLLMSALNQDDTDPNANFLTSSGLGSSFEASSTDNTSAPSVFSANPLGGTGPLDFNGSDILMVIMSLMMSVANGFQNQMGLQAKMATANKKSIEQIQEAADAMQDLQDALSNMKPPLDPTKNPNVDLATLLKNQGPQLTHLTAWLKDQGDWNGDINDGAGLQTALQKARDNTNSVSSGLGNTGSLIPTDFFQTATFDSSSVGTLQASVKGASTQLTNNNSVSQQLLTSLQATTQQRAQVMTMSLSILDVFKQIGQKLTQ